MLNFLLAYGAAIGWVLSLIAATVTVVIFQITFGFSSFIAVPVGVLAFVSMTILWARLLHTLGHEPPRRGGQ
jgi:hypothetical protein